MVEHPTTETIAAYLSNRLPASERVTLETHLSACRECRQEVMSARRLLEGRTVRPRWQVLVPAAAAAILALALVSRGLLSPPPDTVRAGNDAEAGVIPSLRAVGPANRATVDRNAIVFAWTAGAGRPLYRLTLTDGSGHTIWTQSTDDTTVGLPASVALAPDRSYFWYVDALDSAGQSLTTGTHQFSTAP